MTGLKLSTVTFKVYFSRIVYFVFASIVYQYASALLPFNINRFFEAFAYKLTYFNSTPEHMPDIHQYLNHDLLSGVGALIYNAVIFVIFITATIYLTAWKKIEFRTHTENTLINLIKPFTKTCLMFFALMLPSLATMVFYFLFANNAPQKTIIAILFVLCGNFMAFRCSFSLFIYLFEQQTIKSSFLTSWQRTGRCWQALLWALLLTQASVLVLDLSLDIGLIWLHLSDFIDEKRLHELQLLLHNIFAPVLVIVLFSGYQAEQNKQHNKNTPGYDNHSSTTSEHLSTGLPVKE